MSESIQEDWRTQLTLEDRKKLVAKIVTVLKDCVTDQGNAQNDEARLNLLATKFEDNVFQNSSNKNHYLHNIANKMYNLKTKAKPVKPGTNTPMVTSVDPVAKLLPNGLTVASLNSIGATPVPMQSQPTSQLQPQAQLQPQPAAMVSNTSQVPSQLSIQVPQPASVVTQTIGQAQSQQNPSAQVLQQQLQHIVAGKNTVNGPPSTMGYIQKINPQLGGPQTIPQGILSAVNSIPPNAPVSQQVNSNTVPIPQPTIPSLVNPPGTIPINLTQKMGTHPNVKAETTNDPEAQYIEKWHHMKQYIRPLEQIYAHIERSLKAKGTQTATPDKHENLELVKSRILFLQKLLVTPPDEQKSKSIDQLVAAEKQILSWIQQLSKQAPKDIKGPRQPLPRLASPSPQSLTLQPQTIQPTLPQSQLIQSQMPSSQQPQPQLQPHAQDRSQHQPLVQPQLSIQPQSVQPQQIQPHLHLPAQQTHMSVVPQTPQIQPQPPHTLPQSPLTPQISLPSSPQYIQTPPLQTVPVVQPTHTFIPKVEEHPTVESLATSSNTTPGLSSVEIDPLGSLLDVIAASPTETMKVVAIDTAMVLERLGKYSKSLENNTFVTVPVEELPVAPLNELGCTSIVVDAAAIQGVTYAKQKHWLELDHHTEIEPDMKRARQKPDTKSSSHLNPVAACLHKLKNELVQCTYNNPILRVTEPSPNVVVIEGVLFTRKENLNGEVTKILVNFEPISTAFAADVRNQLPEVVITGSSIPPFAPPWNTTITPAEVKDGKTLLELFMSYITRWSSLYSEMEDHKDQFIFVLAKSRSSLVLECRKSDCNIPAIYLSVPYKSIEPLTYSFGLESGTNLVPKIFERFADPTGTQTLSSVCAAWSTVNTIR